MHTYEIYLTTGKTITVTAKIFEVNYDRKRLVFKNDEYGDFIAMFMLSNICGFKEVDNDEKRGY